MTLTNRSRKALEKDGYIVDIVERYNSFSHHKNDLYGMFDLLALHPEKHLLVGVQVTSKSNLSSRRTKIKNAKAYVPWLLTKSEVLLHGWVKKKGRFVLTAEYMRGD